MRAHRYWILAACLALPSGAFAATITVTDSLGAGQDPSGGCSLRQAILSANGDTAIGGCAAGDGADTIRLAGAAVPQLDLEALPAVRGVVAFEMTDRRMAARFDAQGLTVTLPGATTWSWRLAALETSDGAPVPGVRTGDAAPAVRPDGAIEYDRGAMVEEYVDRGRAVEQRFHIAAPLSLGGGDLVIRGAVSASETFRDRTSDVTWGDVRLGAVLVLDARGATLPAYLHAEADQTWIVVDGAALATAAYPVLVDPEIGPDDFRISDMGPDGDSLFDAVEPKVAYNATDNEFLVVWEADDNQDGVIDDETEIFGQRLSAAGAPSGTNDFRITTVGGSGDGSTDAKNPDVAWNSTDNEYLVVFQGVIGAGDREILGQVLNADGTNKGAAFRLSDAGPEGNSGFLALNPAVTYNATENEYLVVWKADRDTVDDELEIFGQRVTAAGAEIGDNDFRISSQGPDGNGDFDANNPNVNWNSVDNEYLVVWHGVRAPGETEIYGQRLSKAGADLGGDFRISHQPPDDADIDAQDPSVAYSATTGRYLVVWEGQRIADEAEIYGQRLSNTGAELAGDFKISAQDPADPDIDAVNPSVVWASASDQFVVVWQGDTVTPGEEEIFHARVGVDGTIVEAPTRISTAGPDGNTTFLAKDPALAYNSAADETLVVWEGSDNGSGLVTGEFEILGQLLEPPAICGNSVVETGENCDDGNSAAGDGCSDSCQAQAGYDCSTVGQLCVCLAGHSGPTCNTNIQVNTTVEGVNSDGDCGLHEAVQAANTNAAVDGCSAGSAVGVDPIVVPAGTYVLSSELFVTSDVAILGAGASTTTLDGNDATRVINVQNQTAPIQVIIGGVTVQQGSAADGGCIRIRLDVGSANLLDSVVQDCTATSGSGGGLQLFFGALVVERTTFANNTAGSGNGGGIVATSNAASLSVVLSTFSGNSALTGGAAIMNASSSFALVSSTLAGNEATGTSPTGAVESGLGDFINNVIVSNTGSAVTPDVSVSGTSHGNNLIGQAVAAAFDHSTDALGVTQTFTALQDNGGETPTLGFSIGAARNAGTCLDHLGATLATDQRGVARPQAGGCDVGAFESDAACGDNTVQYNEVCDGSDHAGSDCTTVGFSAGTLACAVGCAAFDTSGCSDQDHGDALASYGDAAHEATGPTLGPLRDAEGAANPTADSSGDDSAGVDDEDGVTIGPLPAGTDVDVSVLVVGGGGILDAWMDFDGSGTFEVGEQVAAQAVLAGVNVLSVTVPANATLGNTTARFRLSTVGGLAPFGLAPDGEVEDYQVTVIDCGDGVVGLGEQCDDGDAAGADGCSATCQLEPGWDCPNQGQDCVCDATHFGDTCSNAIITIDTQVDGLVDGDGKCSLREAIQAANTNAVVDACAAGTGDDRIVVPSGTYTIAIAGDGEDANATGDFDLDSNVHLQGAGAATTIIDANGEDRVFEVHTGTAALTGLTVTQGFADNGAGVLNFDDLVIEDCELNGNLSIDDGAGIYNLGVSVVVRRSVLAGNVSDTLGGGYYGGGPGLFENCTFDGNAAADGGAAYLEVSSGDQRFESCTFAGNTATADGPAIESLVVAADLVIFNSLFSGNTGGTDECALLESPTTADFNLAATGSPCLLGANAVTADNAALGDLAVNGSGTSTRAPGAGSAALDAGSCLNSQGAALTEDQRGEARPATGCDIGAYEVVCNDGHIAGDETCEDGNAATGDGCDDSCVLETGYTCDVVGQPCTDIDECDLDTDDCGVGATCVNTVGGFDCTCEPGFELAGADCVDTDECLAGTDDCAVGQTCANAPGTFTCVCAGCSIGGPVTRVTLGDNDTLDLETGDVQPLTLATTAHDFLLTTDPEPLMLDLQPLQLFQVVPVGSFLDTTDCDAQPSLFGAPPGPIVEGVVVLVLTDTGHFYKVGVVGIDGGAITIDYAHLSDGTPPAGVCDDTDLCTDDVCNLAARTCGNAGKDCTAEDGECTVGGCNPADGLCFPAPKSENTPCDDGNPNTTGDSCDASGACIYACGNGALNLGEACDDGNIVSADGCSADCSEQEVGYECLEAGSPCETSCGDGVKAAVEGCDDGVQVDQGCDVNCDVTPGWTCTEDLNNLSACTPICGDGLILGNEECDDIVGAPQGGDGCSATCTREFGFQCDNSNPPSVCAPECGDGEKHPSELCDDGVLAGGDGCSAGCEVEFGYTCTGTDPSLCITDCGDGEKAAVEDCDDGNNDALDGCSPGCSIEFGFDCVGTEPSDCNSACGDGQRASDEECDDAPPNEDGDGCSAQCTLESGYLCLGPEPTTCTAQCGTVFDLNASDQEWIVVGLGPHAFAQGASGGFGASGFETGLDTPLPAVEAVDTSITRRIPVPGAGSPAPELLIDYQLDGEGGTTDCLSVYVGDEPDMVPGDLEEVTCDATAGPATLTIDLAAHAGTTVWVSIRFQRDVSGGLPKAGAFIDSVRVRSDADDDGVSEHGDQAGCDFCVDVDEDGYGSALSNDTSTCDEGAGVDCNDDPNAGGAPINPAATEDCTTAIDEDCDGEALIGDPQCFEDCANGVDDGEEGGNGIVDCADAFCASDAFCNPCDIDFTFTHGGAGWTADPVFEAVTIAQDESDGFWKTGGLDGLDPGKVAGKLSVTLDVPSTHDGGPRPRLEVVYLLEGQGNPAFDVVAICVDNPGCTVNGGFEFKTGSNTQPNASAPKDGGPDDFTENGFDHVFVDVSDKIGQQITVTVLFDSVNDAQQAREGLTITQVRLASDSDKDGEYEGQDPTCDPCWDGDFDGYVHADSPGYGLVCPNATQAPDCDDTAANTNPGVDEDCNLPGDEDCNGLANTADEDACGAEDCANFKDDNSDNLVDCLDPQCAGDEACDVCAQHFSFTRGESGWLPADNDPDSDPGTSVFQHGKSAGDNAVKGWSTVRDGLVSSANTTGAPFVRAWLTRTVQIPAAAPEPRLEIRYNLQGDAVEGKDVFGVCFDVDKSQCHALSAAAVTFSTSDDTAPGELDVAVIDLPSSFGNVDVVIFYDTVDDQGNDNPGLFIADILMRSDIDGDEEYENAIDPSCDDCVDSDGDDHGSSLVSDEFIAGCLNPEPDCNDDDPLTKPGIAEDCGSPGDQNCNDLSDSEEELCSACGDGQVTAGEQCDDGVDPQSGLPVGGDGCDASCQVEVGALHLTELHLTTLGGQGEQWFELYNSSDSTVDLQQLLLAFQKKNGQTQSFSDDCVPLAGKSGSVGPNSFYVIALGDIETSDGLDADAECDGLFQLSATDDVLRLKAGDTVIDEVDFSGFSCELGSDLKGGQSRSLELPDAENKNNGTNDGEGVWCLAGPKAVYGISGNHFGSPGASGTCGEFACDGADDDCDAQLDENDYVDGVDPEFDTWDTDGDGTCDAQDCPGVTCVGKAVCEIAQTGQNCAVHPNDEDADCIPDCKDSCVDFDGDGWGKPGGLLPHTCNVKQDGTDAVDCKDELSFVHPDIAENVAIAGACTNGLDDNCDGTADCLDVTCAGAPECGLETCDEVETIGCGESKTVEPLTNAFACGDGADAFLEFVATSNDAVTIELTNLGQKQYAVSVLTGTCSEQSDCNPVLHTALGVPTVTAACGAAPNDQSVSVADATSYFLVVDQVGDCGGAGTTAATVRIICTEVCTSVEDEDGDGFVGCADADCVPDPVCKGEDFDNDGVTNGAEITCGSLPKNPLSKPATDDLGDPDNDQLLNCVDPDDDNDGFTDAEEEADCEKHPLLSKNDATIHPGHVLNCTEAGIDADCNEIFDTQEALCGGAEKECGNAVDDDLDGETDCDDVDCVPVSLCKSADWDEDTVPNGVEITCNFNPIDPLDTPGALLADDFDGDGIPNCVDTDDDGDGFDDVTEQICGSLPLDENSVPVNTDLALGNGDTQCDAVDPDDDNDGFDDEVEQDCLSDPKDPAVTPHDAEHDIDQDQICNANDPDIDGDSWTNGVEEACGTDMFDGAHNPTTLLLDIDDDKVCDALDNDDDGDQWSDDKESLCGTDKNDPTSVPEDVDGDGKCDVLDKDADDDDWPDAAEQECGTDPLDPASNPTALGEDQDDDGLCDKIDDNDDGDSWNDATEVECGTDPFDPADQPVDTDGDLLCDAKDSDDDGDTWPDATELACDSDPLDPAVKPVDGDGDGQCDLVDPDADPDADGWLNKDEDNCGTDTKDPQSVPVDTDSDTVCDALDLDDDNDGWSDSDEIACETAPLLANLHPVDTDADGTCNLLDTDDDGDGIPDEDELLCGTDPLDLAVKPLEIDVVDTDEDGQANCVDDDDDGDDVTDVDELAIGSDPLVVDTDEDGLDDGVENADHDDTVDPAETDPDDKDTDDDGLSDFDEANSCYPTETDVECAPSAGYDPDSDADGLTDGQEDADGSGETEAGETSPLIADSDGDNVLDGEEVFCVTDPLDAESVPVDKDADGVCDGSQLDTDDDGIADGVEDYCGTDPYDNSETPSFEDLEDTDEDGVLNCVDGDDDGDSVDDVVELECKTDPRDVTDFPTSDQLLDTDKDGALDCSDLDDDNDGLEDTEELALGTEPLDQDSDDDGLSDGKEVNVTTTDPLSNDSDGDGIIDGVELGVAEGTKDSTGYTGDQDPSTATDPKNPDTDDDGVIDGEEDANQNGRVDEGEGDPLSSKDGLQDTDGDGLTDRDELLIYNTLVDNPDSDGDHLNDKLEVTVHKTDPLLADTDGGGVVDGFEVQNGTDPLVGEDDFSHAVLSGDNVFGCAAGRGGAGGPIGWLLLLSLAGLVALRIRRRTGGLAGILLIAGALALMAAPETASAQTSVARSVGNVNIENFMPQGSRFRVWSVEHSQVGPQWQPYASLLFHGERESLKVQAGEHQELLVSSAYWADLSIGIGLFDWIQLEVGLPIALAMESDASTQSIAPVEGAGMGDMVIRLRGSLLKNTVGGFGIGLSTGLTLPTGSGEHFRGDEGVGVLLNTIFDYRTDLVVVALNVGFRIRSATAEFLTVEFGHELTYGLGIDVQVWADRIHISTELFGKTPLTEPFGALEATSLEWLFGPKWWILPSLSFQAAVGAGLVQGYGTPDFRFVTGLQWAPRSEDTDGDGIDDRVDLCPLGPEDKDGYADSDGCPEVDNDNDGVLDVDDKCPNESEDLNGVSDEDGCPDSDTDGDGVADAMDKCPEDREDLDNWRDADGCPDPDNDGDGLQDGEDKCPNAPETRNGFEDDDGCPDTIEGGTAPLQPQTDPECEFKIRQQVMFVKGNAELSAEANERIREVAELIKRNGLIVEVSVDGHASEEGTDVNNLALSRARARAVRDALVSHGVARAKLAARGFGEAKPAVDATTQEALMQNRRVDFDVTLGGKCAEAAPTNQDEDADGD